MTAELKRLRAETDRYVAIDAKALDCDPEEDALAHALAAERAAGDAERERLRGLLREAVQHMPLIADGDLGERLRAALREEAPDARD